MTATTPEEAREYLAGLALASAHEIDELRRTSIELKLRQTWALMHAAAIQGDDADRERGIRQVRERWARLYTASCE